eukprot:jgi/Botrbrau1/19762/Bobra.0124s0014.2
MSGHWTSLSHRQDRLTSKSTGKSTSITESIKPGTEGQVLASPETDRKVGSQPAPQITGTPAIVILTVEDQECLPTSITRSGPCCLSICAAPNLTVNRRLVLIDTEKSKIEADFVISPGCPPAVRRVIEGNYGLVALDLVHLSCTITVTALIPEEKGSAVAPPTTEVPTTEVSCPLPIQAIQQEATNLPSPGAAGEEEPEATEDAPNLPSVTGPVKAGTGYKCSCGLVFHSKVNLRRCQMYHKLKGTTSTVPLKVTDPAVVFPNLTAWWATAQPLEIRYALAVTTPCTLPQAPSSYEGEEEKNKATEAHIVDQMRKEFSKAFHRMKRKSHQKRSWKYLLRLVDGQWFGKPDLRTTLKRLRSASEGTIGQPMTTIYEDDLRDSASIGAILAQIIEAKLEKQENIAKLSFKPSNDPLVHSQVPLRRDFHLVNSKNYPTFPVDPRGNPYWPATRIPAPHSGYGSEPLQQMLPAAMPFVNPSLPSWPVPRFPVTVGGPLFRPDTYQGQSGQSTKYQTMHQPSFSSRHMHAYHAPKPYPFGTTRHPTRKDASFANATKETKGDPTKTEKCTDGVIGLVNGSASGTCCEAADLCIPLDSDTDIDLDNFSDSVSISSSDTEKDYIKRFYTDWINSPLGNWHDKRKPQ